jgi:hypothetical protein
MADPSLSYVRRLEESGIVTRCEITTYEPEGSEVCATTDLDDQSLDLVFVVKGEVEEPFWFVGCDLAAGHDPLGPKKKQSDWLHDALLEVPTSSEKLSISFSPSDANEHDVNIRSLRNYRP